MLIKLKNKDQLIVDDFTFKCAIGKAHLSSKKKEGDKTTPKGLFSIGKLYYRADRVKEPSCKIESKIIKKNMGWCDDINSKFYNKIMIINKKIKHEKLFRKDSIYDYLIVVEYNTIKPKPGKGSAIFLHLTNNYKKTAGCIAVKKKDMLIILKILKKKSKIKII